MPPIIEARTLHKQYRLGDVTVDALRGVDFSAQPGEFVAIMGPSGSGKSTLMHLLGGLDSASGGDILLNGQSLVQMSDDDITLTRRRQIGFIFQFFNLIPTLTAAENIALPLLMDGQALELHLAWVDSLLALVGLEDRRQHRPHQLSGGQQQRVAIARALVMKPALLLADEPTGNLDSAAGQDILRLLRRACDETGQTMVMVTHDTRAAAIADRVVFLKDGQIAHDLVLTAPLDKSRTQEIVAVATALQV